MNTNNLTLLTATALILMTGCVTAGTWVNGCYIDGPLCTVCDGTKIITHAYGTTVCTHCDGTGIEPPEETTIVNTVVVDTWSPPPRWHHHRPIVRRPPPPRHNRPRPAAHAPVSRPAARPVGGRRGGRSRR